MFDTTKTDLKDILSNAKEGKLQLPEFQRSYVWGDADVRSLLASVLRGFPIGALLMLETGGEIRFKPRMLEGLQNKNIEPTELLLDGQQRITSLFQTLLSGKPVKTRTHQNKQVERYYYLNMEAAIQVPSDVEKLIIGVPADKVQKRNFGKDIVLDLSSRAKEFETHHFPLNLMFNNRDWFYDWRDYWRDKGEEAPDWERQFVKKFIDVVNDYKVPIIKLDKSNSREAICIVFEKVNVGGKKLDAFELLTAIFAGENYDLREDWIGDAEKGMIGRKKRMIEGPQQKRDVLAGVESTDFLQACTLLYTRQRRIKIENEGKTGKELPRVECNRNALLALPLEGYTEYADFVEKGFIKASKFLNEMKIIWQKDVPYPPLIVALAAFYGLVGNNTLSDVQKTKLRQWFWSVALGELYGSSTESRLAKDVPQLFHWLFEDGEPPASVGEAIFQQSRLKSLRSRRSAAYKSVHALMMHEGCEDFITGEATTLSSFFDEKIDIHHIFPVAWCKKQGIHPDVFNSIINKTPLSSGSNNLVGGAAPSEYLQKIETEKQLSPERIDEILRTHLIEPELLRTDNFDAFFKQRMNALSDMIGKAMHKSVVMEEGENEPVFEEPETIDQND
jgi:hypothetical protein